MELDNVPQRYFQAFQKWPFLSLIGLACLSRIPFLDVPPLSLAESFTYGLLLWHKVELLGVQHQFWLLDSLSNFLVRMPIVQPSLENLLELRFPSVVFGALGTWMSYQIVRVLYDQRTAYVVGCISIISPFLLSQSIHMHSGSLLFFLSTWFIWLHIKPLDSKRPAGTLRKLFGDFRQLLGKATLLIILSFVDYSAGPFLVLFYIIYLYELGKHCQKRLFALHFILFLTTICFLIISVIWLFPLQQFSVQHVLASIEGIHIFDIWAHYLFLWEAPLSLWINAGFCFIILLPFIFNRDAMKGKPWGALRHLWLSLTVGVAFIIIEGNFGYLHFQQSYMAMLPLFLAGWWSHLKSWKLSKKIKWSYALLVLLPMLGSSIMIMNQSHPQYNEPKLIKPIVENLNELAKEGDLVLIDAWQLYPYYHYYQTGDYTLRSVTLPKGPDELRKEPDIAARLNSLSRDQKIVLVSTGLHQLYSASTHDIQYFVSSFDPRSKAFDCPSPQEWTLCQKITVVPPEEK